MSSVGEDFPKEQARCRSLLEQYAEISKMPGVNVSFAVASIKGVLGRAEQAIASGDILEILKSYEEMRGCS